MFEVEVPVSITVEYDVELSGDAPAERLRELTVRVDRIAEIPNSLRGATAVSMGTVTVG